MSVHIVNLSKHADERSVYTSFGARVLSTYHASVAGGAPDLKFVVREVMDKINELHRSGALVAPYPLNFMTDDEATKFEIGRTGIRDLVSAWAKENYPAATHEVNITFIEPTGGTHVLLVYL